MPPVKLTWYDGSRIPPKHPRAGLPPAAAGILFVGDKGHAAGRLRQLQALPGGGVRRLQAARADHSRLDRPSPEWIQACKTGSPTTCNFDYSGALTEAVLLGNVAYRTGEQLEWDAATLKATNCPQADQFLHREYRKGWEL